MTIDKPSQVIEDLLYAVDHQLLDDPVGEALHLVIRSGVRDSFAPRELHNRVFNHRIAQQFNGPFRLHKLIRGRIALGRDRKHRWARIAIAVLGAHTLVLAGSGAGKTVRSRWLALQVASRTKGAWLFDFRKREFRCLVPWFRRLGVKVIVVPARRMRLNPLEVPKGVDPFQWASRVADMLVQVFRLPPRATKLLQRTLLDLFDHFGVLAGGKKYPTLFDLRETIALDGTANPQARQAVVDALDPVLISLRGVLCYRRGWSSTDLATRTIILELDGVGEVEKDLILNSLIMPEFTARVARGVTNKKMDLWICCDEAARMVSTSSTTGGINDLIGLIRGTGIGLDLSIQFADIAPAILSNTVNKFLGRCGSHADYETMASAMGLTAEQRRHLYHKLVPGMFVGQIGEGDWRHPFLFTVPYVEFAKPPGYGQGASPFVQSMLPALASGSAQDATVTDSGDHGIEILLALPTEAAEEFRNWRPRGWTMASGAGRQGAVSKASLSDAERRYLQAVVDHPAQPSSKYPSLAGIGIHQAISIRRNLVERGYLREHKVNTGRRGRASIVLEPLPAALAALGLQEGAS